MIARLMLGVFLAFTGISHLTWSRTEFLAQVPTWFPVNADAVVILSGVIEVGLGAALIFLPGKRVPIGWVVAAFFVAVFPGNISQFATHTDAFGLNSDGARGVRLLFQPVLVLWALWSTQAWSTRAWHRRRFSRSQAA